MSAEHNDTPVAQPEWDVDAATDVATRLHALGVYWVEEPLHRGDYDGPFQPGFAARGSC